MSRKWAGGVSSRVSFHATSCSTGVPMPEPAPPRPPLRPTPAIVPPPVPASPSILPVSVPALRPPDRARQLGDPLARHLAAADTGHKGRSHHNRCKPAREHSHLLDLREPSEFSDLYHAAF